MHPTQKRNNKYRDPLNEHCKMGCTACYYLKRAIDPIFKEGDNVSYYSKDSYRHGDVGVVTGSSRCEILKSNIYMVKYKDYTMGHHEIYNTIIPADKQIKLNEFTIKPQNMAHLG